MTNHLSNVEAEFRAQWESESAAEDLGTSLIRACISRAALRFSKWQPRQNCLAEINILSTDELLTLPSNFFYMEMDILYSAITGINLRSSLILSVADFNYTGIDTSNDYDGVNLSYGLYNRSIGSFIGDNFQGILSESSNASSELRLHLSTNDEGNYVLRFGKAFGKDKTIKFFYNAIHEITNDEGSDPVIPGRYTIPRPYRYDLIELALGEACLAMFRREANKKDQHALENSEKWLEVAKEHFATVWDLAPMGART